MVKLGFLGYKDCRIGGTRIYWIVGLRELEILRF